MKKKSPHSVKTPLGHEVTINKEIWRQHVIIQHPEMTGKVEDVLSALANPEFIAFNP